MKNETKVQKLSAVYKQFLGEIAKALNQYQEEVKLIFQRIEKEKIKKIIAKINKL